QVRAGVRRQHVPADDEGAGLLRSREGNGRGPRARVVRGEGVVLRGLVQERLAVPVGALARGPAGAGGFREAPELRGGRRAAPTATHAFLPNTPLHPHCIAANRDDLATESGGGPRRTPLRLAATELAEMKAYAGGRTGT